MTEKGKGLEQLYSDEINAWVDEFIGDVSQCLLPNEYQGTALYRFLFQMARSYHIPEQDVDEILNEGVKRGIEYIQQKEKPIIQPKAWLRKTCLNIMGSWVNANIKYEKKSQFATELTPPPSNPLAESELVEQLEFLEKAVKELSQSDQHLLRMRFWENKTYKQIQYRYKLANEDGNVPSVPALRKRESRALEKLRNSFYKIYEKVGENPQ